MYSNVVTAIDKIPTYLLRFNSKLVRCDPEAASTCELANWFIVISLSFLLLPAHISERQNHHADNALQRPCPEDPARLRKQIFLDQFAMLQSPKATATLVNCDNLITPDCLYALYDFYYTPQATAKNS